MAFHEHFNDFDEVDSDDSYRDSNYTSRYVLGIAEIHSDSFHGGSYEYNHDDAEMNGHFLFMMAVSRDWRLIRNMSTLRRLSLIYRYRNHRGELRHPNIRNYEEIMFNSLTIQPQIVEIIEGPNMYTSCVIKTTYLKQLQRKWKKIYAERKRLLKERKNPLEQMKRQLCGKYSRKYK